MSTEPVPFLDELATAIDALRVDLALGHSEAEADLDLELRAASEADPLAPFLRDLRQTPRMDARTERRLARRAAAARRLARRLAASRGKDPARARRLTAVEQARREAEGRLAAGHLRLAVFLARRYAGRGVPLADLIQEASLALIRAARRYDYRSGARFATYATPFVRQALARSVRAHRGVLTLPVRLVDALPRLVRVRSRLEARLGREPYAEEIARLARLRQDRAEALVAGLRRPVPLDAPAEEGSRDTVGDRLSLPDGQTPYDLVAAREETALLEQALASLPPREALTLRLRYGLGEDEPATLEEVGARLGVSKERARQIEERARRRLRQALDGARRGTLQATLRGA
ncbi:MAG TPA: sigma-70 family RNA polymerase sigma factor [Thermodesulfobacteriota bacterium]